MSNTPLKRSGMARVNEESHSFTCRPLGYSQNHTCLWSPAE